MNGTQTIERALDILFVLTDAESTMSVSEIADKVGIPESTAYRLLQTLERKGIVERKSVGQIGLGLRILDLARSLHQQIDGELFNVARPIMERLTEQTNESSLLCVRTGVQAICVQNVETRQMIRMSIENGKIMPLHRGASGKAILAFENGRTRDQVLSAISDDNVKSSVSTELARTREMGYSFTIGEVDPYIFGIAAPIFDTNRRVIASLTIGGPTVRMPSGDNNRLIQSVVEAADEISARMVQLSKLTF
jgi:DNA-binding IclR family transcriptional regulator